MNGSTIFAVLVTLTAFFVYGVMPVPANGHIGILSVGDGGVFLNMSFTPGNPKTFEKTTVYMTVASNEKNDFLMDLVISSEDGQIISERNYSFSLDKYASQTFSMEFVPTDVNRHIVTANLYNTNRTVFYGSHSETMQAESDIGPIHVEFAMATGSVLKGQSLPIIVDMENFGTSAVDATLTTAITCANRLQTGQNIPVHLENGKVLEKYLLLPTCNELGQHNVIASLKIDNVMYASHQSQYFERQDIIHIHSSLPTAIIVPMNNSYDLSVMYRNSNNYSIYNVKPLVFGIPSTWFTLTPQSIQEIAAGESTIAHVVFQPPENTTGNYPLLIGASGDNLYEVGTVTLIVTKALGPTILSWQILTIAAIIAATVIVVIVMVVIIKREKTKRGIMGKVRKKLKERGML